MFLKLISSWKHRHNDHPFSLGILTTMLLLQAIIQLLKKEINLGSKGRENVSCLVAHRANVWFVILG